MNNNVNFVYLTLNDSVLFAHMFITAKSSEKRRFEARKIG